MSTKISHKDLESMKTLTAEIDVYEKSIGRLEVEKIGLIMALQKSKVELGKINKRISDKHGKDAVISPDGTVIKPNTDVSKD